MNRQSLVAWLAILATIGAFFGPAFVTGRPLLFRDSAHFYYPLFKWCCREWAAGRVPLWNPLENCGTPVLADATSSVLYPGKLIFALPLSYDTCFNLYVVLHIVLAAATCYLAARAWQASHAAAAMAAISYSCGGSVVFQYCNIVFLVGAAWLPLAIFTADRMLRCGKWTAALGLGAVLAMMVLGGDPQAAYHVLLGCAVYVAVLAWPNRSRFKLPQSNHLLFRIGHIGLAAAVAFCLSAAQVLPSMEATSRSDRAVFDRPRNIYEAARVTWQQPLDDEPVDETRSQSIIHGLFGEPQVLTHHEAVYEFSIGPWRLAEFLWPNIGGRMFPTNARWFSLLPAEGRVWTPTLYLGLLPALLAVGSLCAPSVNRRERWLKCLLVTSVVGSFGYYGLGWIAHELAAARGMKSQWIDTLGNPVGGIYWLLTTLLPGYVYFRYPAKLLPLAALAICLLAAKRFDRAFGRNEKWLPVTLLFLAIGSGLAAIMTWLGGQNLLANVTNSDSTLGPFDAVLARWDIILALLHATGASLALALLAYWTVKRPTSAGLIKWVTVFTVAVDVWLANAWTVVSVEPNRNQTPSAIAHQIRAKNFSSIKNSTEPRILRGNLAIWRPPSFRHAKSSNRLVELENWERQTLLPKYSLLDSIGTAEAHGSITSVDYQALLYVAKQHGPRQPDKSMTPQPTALRLLGTNYLVLPESHEIEFASRLAQSDSNWPESAALWQMNWTMPRCWIVHDIQALAELKKPRRKQAIEERTREVLFPDGKARDIGRTAVVETDDPLREWSNHQADIALEQNTKSDVCKLVLHSSQRVVVKTKLNQPGLLVLADAWYPGWKAFATSDTETHQVPIYRTNRVLRGVWLSAGQQTIEFRYKPLSFYGGATISAASWLVLALIYASRIVRLQK